MDTDLRHPRIAFSLLLLFGFIAGLFTFAFNAQPAHAASETRCGDAECYVDSTVRSESDWATEPYTSSTGATVTPGSGSSETPKFMTTYVACSAWHQGGSGRMVFSYPAEDSSSFRCWFPDRTMTEADTCPPRSDRASNGRVDYYVERVRADGSTTWVYARFRCLYPTDEYAPIALLKGEGKVYTGGQASFFHTSTAPNTPANTTYNGGGTLSNTTGYIDRGVDLNRPQDFTGAWQPAFTAQTLNRSGQPVYGFYRLDWRLDYRICQQWGYPAWLGVPDWTDCSRAGTDTAVNPYTYACNFTPPLTTGIRTDALFVPSLCAPPWQCSTTGDYRVGDQVSRVVVLRNGQPIPVTFPQPSVHGADINNVRNWQTQHNINPGSTPAEVYARGSWEWGKWGTYSPTGTISFDWASESEAQPFSWSTQYRFTADWWLPVQDGTGYRMTWVTGSATCPIETRSTNVEVVRSVNR